MTTLQRLMLTLTVVPFTFFRVMRSTWMTHFRRCTCTILPSRPLWVPRHHLHLFVLAHRDRPRVVLVTPSAERGALISKRRTLEGAVKCSFRHFHREPDTPGLYFIVAGGCGERRRPFLRIVWDYLLWLRMRIAKSVEAD
ncbi:hypothetical protein C4D60_Mb10t15620 [Musa balbisiana]|uniref:Uncharacterized protein n=1 Tax=Musa balbisiana TaxID=52838 RepID=A0A4S8IXE2_MUSBA|nr:hypothetical protein C4D60_Mb10t15620 [Musa balbisiana]